MRLREHSDRIPKPLAEIGSRPVLWHLMRYYAHYGYKDFILCLGHGGSAIKDYFLNYNECVSNDFVLTGGGRSVELLRKDIDDWRITFADTGLHSNLGERLRRVKNHLQGEEVFMANYADGLSDLDLASYISAFRATGKTATFLSVRVPQTFHIVHSDGEGHALRLEDVAKSPLRINGGFFVFRQEIFDYMRPGEELVVEPFQRLIDKRELLAVTHDGFWHSMDTFKDKIRLDELVSSPPAPWEVWAR
jgi:glucose-1-phosphate cytidylyltransferase